LHHYHPLLEDNVVWMMMRLTADNPAGCREGVANSIFLYSSMAEKFPDPDIIEKSSDTHESYPTHATVHKFTPIHNSFTPY